MSSHAVFQALNRQTDSRYNHKWGFFDIGTANDPLCECFRHVFRPPVGRPRFIGYAKVNKRVFLQVLSSCPTYPNFGNALQFFHGPTEFS
jgi:hypothetical protein